MPLGAFRLNSLARYAAEAPVEQRTAVTVTANGDAQVDTAQSKFGGASALFDGTGDRLETPNTGIKLGTETTTWTVEGWLRVSTLPSSFKGFLSNQDGAITGGGGSNNGWGAYINSSNQIQFIQYVGAPVRKTTTAITANTWNHFAFVRDGTSFKIYLNGTEEYTTTSYASSTDVDDNIFIGTSFNISNGYNGLLDFNGYIDEVRISNTARYTSNFTPSTSAFTNDADTLLLLHMDGTDGSTTFIDDNGTGRSAVGVSALGNAQVDTAQSKFGGASALFDGTGDYLELGDVSITQDEDLTIEGWVRFNALPSIYAMFVGGAGTSEYVGLRNFSGTWALNAAYNDSSVGTYYHNYELGSTPTTGVWYHWAVVKSGSTIKHFWNGTELTTDYNSAGTMTSGHGWSNVSRIGTWTGSGYEVNGHLDEFRMSNTARYTTSFTAPTEPFENDNNTLLLLHMDRYDADTTVFLDDNGETLPTYTPPAGAAWDSYDGTANGSYTQIVNGDADAPAYGVVMFDDTYGIFVYGDEGNKSVRYHKLTVSGTSVTVGSAIDTGIDYDNITRMLPLKLSSTKAIVHCPYDASSGYVAIIDNSSGTLSHTTRNITSIGNTPNSVVSAVRLSDSNWALAGRKSGQPQVMAYYSIDGSNNITGGVTQGMTDFDQFMYTLPIDSDTVMIVGRNNSNTSKHSVGVYNWSGSAWSRSGSLVDVQTHNGYHVSRQFTQPNTHNVNFFGYNYAQTASDVGIEIIPVAYNSGTPSVGTGFQISDSALESIAVPETNEQQYYAVNLHVVQPDPENAPNLFVAYYEIRQSDNRTGRSHIIIPMEYDSATNTVTKAANETVLNGRGYAYGYLMTPLMAVADANTIVAVSHENDHTRNSSVYDYDIGVIVIKDA